MVAPGLCVGYCANAKDTADNTEVHFVGLDSIGLSIFARVFMLFYCIRLFCNITLKCSITIDKYFQ